MWLTSVFMRNTFSSLFCACSTPQAFSVWQTESNTDCKCSTKYKLKICSYRGFSEYPKPLFILRNDSKQPSKHALGDWQQMSVETWKCSRAWGLHTTVRKHYAKSLFDKQSSDLSFRVSEFRVSSSFQLAVSRWTMPQIALGWARFQPGPINHSPTAGSDWSFATETGFTRKNNLVTYFLQELHCLFRYCGCSIQTVSWTVAVHFNSLLTPVPQAAHRCLLLLSE